MLRCAFLMERRVRTWYDLRLKTIPTESFASAFFTALCAHFFNYNNQRHYRYREALLNLNMRQFKDVMQYKQAYRQMMLYLEDLNELDKLLHYKRGLILKYRIAVLQARCADIASAMAEVDIVADAHQVHVVLPNIANHTVLAPASKVALYMGVEPMQISTIYTQQ